MLVDLKRPHKFCAEALSKHPHESQEIKSHQTTRQDHPLKTWTGMQVSSPYLDAVHILKLKVTN